jgi:hypothetical protein
MPGQREENMLRKTLFIVLAAFGLLVLLWLLLTLIACKPVDRAVREGEAFPLEVATISHIHAAFRAGELSCRQLQGCDLRQRSGRRQG